MISRSLFYENKKLFVFSSAMLNDMSDVYKMKDTTNKLIKISHSTGKDIIYILSDVTLQKSINEYLKNTKINSNKFKVVDLKDLSVIKKSEWIISKIDDEKYDDIYIIDESDNNIKYFKKILRSRNVRYNIINI